MTQRRKRQIEDAVLDLAQARLRNEDWRPLTAHEAVLLAQLKPPCCSEHPSPWGEISSPLGQQGIFSSSHSPSGNAQGALLPDYYLLLKLLCYSL